MEFFLCTIVSIFGILSCVCNRMYKRNFRVIVLKLNLWNLCMYVEVYVFVYVCLYKLYY